MRVNLEKLRATCEEAHHDMRSPAWKELRQLGRQTLAAGGTDAMCELQGLLHDAEINTYGTATRGNGFRPAGTLSSAWEAIPEWANL